MFPFLAQGAGQAFEDAACLSRCLADAGQTAAEIQRALERYQRLRMTRATEVQRRSREASDEEHLPDGPQQRQRDLGLARHDPQEYNSWLYDHDALAHAAEN